MGDINQLANLLWFRAVFSAIVITVVIRLHTAARRGLSPLWRSCGWAACFLGLFLPLERGSLILFGDLRYAMAKFFGQRVTTLTGPPLTVLFILNVAVQLIPCLWFAGIVFFLVKRSRDLRRAYRMIQAGELSTCASYFRRGRSHIYLPPDFETAYTVEEQAMLIAHEKQHIKQHDPLLYRLLTAAECVFWFCPPIHKAVRLFQQDRELLCDERTAQQGYGKQEYGHLLLKAAGNRKQDVPIPGIAANAGSVSERIRAFIEPVSLSKRVVAVMAVVFAVLLGLGFPGFSSVIATDVEAHGVRRVTVTTATPTQDPSRLRMATVLWNESEPEITAMERFVTVEGDGNLRLDTKGMHDYAVSIGLSPEQQLAVMYVGSIRPFWSGYFDNDGWGCDFTVSELETDEMAFLENPHFQHGWVDALNRMI